MSREKLEEVAKSSTKKALEDLKSHLVDNPKLRNKVKDICREDGRMQQAGL